jgi:hypothetical protein
MTTIGTTIALIITTFIAQIVAPVVAELIKSRMSQPKPTPEPNQPTNLTQRPRIFNRLRKAVTFSPLFAMLFPIYELRKYLLDPAPITRPAVFIISLCVTLIWFSFLQFLVYLSLDSVSQSIGGLSEFVLRLSESALKESKSVSLIIDRTDDLYARVESLAPKQLSQTEPDKSTQ